MGTNIKYKDSVFSFLFSNEETLRELYSAISGTELPPDIPITINTLQDVLFMEQINDISFEIGGKLVILIEHQSTINPNMALRLLMYAGRVYEKIIKSNKKNIHTTKAIKIPAPEFYVLYNGTAPYPPEKILKLSDLFDSASGIGLSEKGHPALELEVRVLNINEGMNAEIAEKSKTLAGYSAFVAKIKEYIREGAELAAAMKKAVAYCCSRNILKTFLEENATEVMNMLYTEFNLDEAKEVWREEALEEGIGIGREEVARNALTEGIPIMQIQKITGLDMETIKGLQAGL